MFRKKTISLALLVIIICVISISVYAIENVRERGISVATITYNSSTNRVVMRASLVSERSASIVDEIYTRGEFYRNGSLLDEMELLDSGYSTATVTYNAFAYDGAVYEVLSDGYYIVSILPDYVYYDFSSKSFQYIAEENKSGSKMSGMLIETSKATQIAEYYKMLDENIANSFDINLKEYKKITIEELDKNENNANLLKLYFGIEKNVGDKKPSIYLKNGKEGIIIIKRADGKNEVFFITSDEDNIWKISSHNSKEDIIMDFEKNIKNSSEKNRAQRIINITEIEEIAEE